MPDTLIRKPARGNLALPNLTDYAAACASFSWAMERQTLRGLPGGALFQARRQYAAHEHLIHA